MAIIKQCDRCEKPFKCVHDTTINGIEMQRRNKCNTGYTVIDSYDLCPECVNSFQKWFNGGEHEESE